MTVDEDGDVVAVLVPRGELPGDVDDRDEQLAAELDDARRFTALAVDATIVEVGLALSWMCSSTLQSSRTATNTATLVAVTRRRIGPASSNGHSSSGRCKWAGSSSAIVAAFGGAGQHHGRAAWACQNSRIAAVASKCDATGGLPTVVGEGQL